MNPDNQDEWTSVDSPEALDAFDVGLDMLLTTLTVNPQTTPVIAEVLLRQPPNGEDQDTHMQYLAMLCATAIQRLAHP